MKNISLYLLFFGLFISFSQISCQKEPISEDPILQFKGTHTATVRMSCSGQSLDPVIPCDTTFQSTITITELVNKVNIVEPETNTSLTIPFLRELEEGTVLYYLDPEYPTDAAKFYLETDSIRVSTCIVCGNGGSVAWVFSVSGN